MSGTSPITDFSPNVSPKESWVDEFTSLNRLSNQPPSPASSHGSAAQSADIIRQSSSELRCAAPTTQHSEHNQELSRQEISTFQSHNEHANHVPAASDHDLTVVVTQIAHDPSPSQATSPPTSLPLKMMSSTENPTMTRIMSRSEESDNNNKVCHCFAIMEFI